MPDQSVVLTALLHPVTAGAGILITAFPARTQLIHLSAVDVLVTKPQSMHELEGLVMGVTTLPLKDKCHWYQEPIFWGGVVAAVFVVLNIALW